MQTTEQGTVIFGVVAVEKSVTQQNSIAFKDNHGAIIHINVNALDELIKFRKTLVPLETTFFTK